MLRKILGVLAGLAVAVMIFVGFEYINSQMYPKPAGFDPADHKAMSAYVAALPMGALFTLLAGWVLGSFACGALIRLIGRSDSHTPAYIAGLFLLSAGIVDIFILPYPLWFTIVGVIIFIPATILGHLVVKPRPVANKHSVVSRQ